MNKILAKHSPLVAASLEHNKRLPDTINTHCFKSFLKEYTELLLQEAANKALVNPLNHDGYSYGSQDTIYIEPNENSDYFNFGGTCVVDKESITSIINDINFD